MEQRAGWGRALLAALVVATSLGITTLAAASPTAQTAPAAPVTPAPLPAEEGFQTVEHAIYRLDPAGSAVRVEIVTELTNQSPSTRQGNYISSVYLPYYGLPVVAEAVNVAAAKDDGTPLDVTMEPLETPRFLMAKIDLSPDLFYPNTQTVRLTYDIPSQPPRSEGITRVNPAHARFPVQAFGDPGLSDVEVIVPSTFEVETSESGLTREERGAEVAYVARAIPDPAEFFTFIAARNDAALVKSQVETDDVDIEVQAWPGDEAWGTFVADHLERGLPVLKDLIDQPWNGEDTLEIIETGNPYIYGYSGWYQRTNSLIEITDKLDAVVILHELAHVWFDDNLFSGRWINEAFAEEYSREAAQQLAATVEPLPAIDPADPGAQPLNGWGDPILDESISDSREAYGYNTAVNVLHQIRAEIGFEGLAKVIDAAFDRTPAYQGDSETDDDQAVGVTDWKRLLDLLEELGGSTTAGTLFATHVVDPTEVPLLTARTGARALYNELEDRGGEWSPPLVTRERMGSWSFSDAERSIADANQVLDVRDDLEDVLEPLGLPVPKALEEAYETERKVTGLADVEQQAKDLLAAARELAAATETVNGSRGPFEKLGLLFADPDGALRAAERALDRGDADLATAKARDASDTVDDAQSAGQQRAAGGVVVLSAIGAGGVLLRRRRRNRPAPVPRPPEDPFSAWGPEPGTEAVEYSRPVAEYPTSPPEAE